LPETARPLSPAQAARLETAFGLLRERRGAEALAIVRQIAAQAPSSVDAHHALALCHTECGDHAAAEQSFRRALSLAPGNAMVLGNFATMLRGQGRDEEAFRIFLQAADAGPDGARFRVEAGLAALDLGRSADALRLLELAVAQQAGSARAWHGLGNARRAQGDLEGAEAAFRKAVALAPQAAASWVNLGVVLRLLGRPGDAIACYDRARQAGFRGPELPDARAGALLDVGRAAEALEQARAVVREHPGFAQGHATLANLLWEYGPVLAPGSDPFEAFAAAAQAQPDNLGLRLAYVRFLMESRRHHEALEELADLRTRADHPRLLALEASAREESGQHARAQALFAQAYRALGASDPGFLNAYTRHLLKAGRWQEAAQHAQEALTADPNNQEAWAYLATAWRLLGDHREHWLCDYERLVTQVDVDPPDDFASVDDFLAALRAALEPMHRALRAPVQQSLREGTQTPGRLFGRPDPVIAATQAALTRAIEGWLASLPADAGHPFLSRRARSVRYVGSWSVRLRSSGRHVNHIHPEGWMSSAFYVALPPSVLGGSEGDAGCIQFGQPPVELGLALPPRRILRPRPGGLALFPSYMWHGTLPFEDPEPRLTIAFDMLPRA
jgi:Tfp pilus assembly protein PilF